MKLLYGARNAYPLLSKPISSLASQISRWSSEADRRLQAMYDFLAKNSELSLLGCLSHRDLEHVKIVAYPDSDLGGDIWNSKSTTGYWVELAGLEGRTFPLAWCARFQTSTSTHTCESETVALAEVLKKEVLPLKILLEGILGRKVCAEIMEDNSACITSCEKGFSPAMRYIGRTQKVNLGFLHDVMFPEISEDPLDIAITANRAGGDSSKDISLLKVETSLQKGDLFTKDMDRVRFEQCAEMIGMIDQRKLNELITLAAARQTPGIKSLLASVLDRLSLIHI